MEQISETLRKAICEQIGAEIFNANVYLHICGFLRNKGLDKLAKHFEEQHSEEIGHSKDFFNLLTDLNADVTIPEIDETSFLSINNVMDIAIQYKDRELTTTNSINELKKLAISEDSPIVEEFLRGMISKQQTEMKEANSFMDMATLLPEWWQVMLHGEV